MKPSCLRILNYLRNHGETPLPRLIEPDLGGTEAARRIREGREILKLRGETIRFRYRPGSHTTLYRIEKLVPEQKELSLL